MKHITLISSLILISLVSGWCESQEEIDFLNRQNGTSTLLLSNGEKTLLPHFSGGSATDLYTVYFLGRTERERQYWDVYNKKGFRKGKDSERIHLYTKEIEQYLNAKRERYYIFSICIKESMIKKNAEDEFQLNSNAICKTYLLTDGEWIIADSFNVKNIPKETADYLIDIIKKRRNINVKTPERIY